jgi:hypothetical protein
MDTCARDFSSCDQRYLVFIYLPLPRHDRILALGIRESLKKTRARSILVRSKLAGDIILGERHEEEGQVEDRLLAASALVMMVYGEQMLGQRVWYFGAHCRAPSAASGVPRPFGQSHPDLSPLSDRAFFSWGPLRGVSSTQVFVEHCTGTCKGILFHYENGAVRAVGQCRLNTDRTESVAQPTHLVFRTESLSHWQRFRGPLYAVRVRFEREANVNGNDERFKGWTLREMEGILKFWFTHEYSFVAVEGGE